ncbi:MAG: MFS transporter [Actinomycetes bacterium]
MEQATETRSGGSSRWLSNWDPEDEVNWDSKLAWKTLWITTFTLMLSFCTWFMVSAIAPKLAGAGFFAGQDAETIKTELYWLVAIPGLSGGLLRIVWTFLPPILGTRKLVALSTLLLLIPLVGWFIALQNPATPFAVLLVLAFLSGIGGGNFSGFMPSTSYFFPRAKQGTALGLQAGIGNFGVSLVQLLTPWFIGFALVGTSLVFKTPVMENGKQKLDAAGKGIVTTSDIWLQNAALVYIPFVIIGGVLAWTLLKSVPVKSTLAQQSDIFKNKHTWIMTMLYLMTFGAFSGFAAQFGLLMKNQFGAFAGAPDPLKYLFLGALVGSIARIIFGPIADRVGGAVLTTISGLGMMIGIIFTSFYVTPTSVSDFTPFLWGMLAIFFFAGIGNASTFKQMPMIFSRRQAGGVIGWTSAIAAFGPFIFGVLIVSLTPRPFYWVIAGFCAICVVLNVWFYQRKSSPTHC